MGGLAVHTQQPGYTFLGKNQCFLQGPIAGGRIGTQGIIVWAARKIPGFSKVIRLEQKPWLGVTIPDPKYTPCEWELATLCGCQDIERSVR